MPDSSHLQHLVLMTSGPPNLHGQTVNSTPLLKVQQKSINLSSRFGWPDVIKLHRLARIFSNLTFAATHIRPLLTCMERLTVLLQSFHSCSLDEKIYNTSKHDTTYNTKIITSVITRWQDKVIASLINFCWIACIDISIFHFHWFIITTGISFFVVRIAFSTDNISSYTNSQVNSVWPSLHGQLE